MSLAGLPNFLIIFLIATLGNQTMPVETRYVVMRNNTEVKTFMDKKAADEYDKMLDIADNLAVLLDDAPIELSASDKEQLSIHFAKEREALLIALKAKKPKAPKKENDEITEKLPEVEASKLKKVS